jgi:hypothetical protein
VDDIVEVTPPPRSPGRGRVYAAGLVGAGLVGGVVLAGLNVASAQTSPTPTPSTAPGTPGTAKPFRHGGPDGPGRRGGPFGGPGRLGGLRGALHGEFTTRAPGGGYQVLAMQAGQATAVSATSITVKSADGYEHTYTVGDTTDVLAGDNGIADVKTGDDVRVLATVKGGTYAAVEVADTTRLKNLRGRWHPARPKPGTAPGTTPSNAT